MIHLNFMNGNPIDQVQLYILQNEKMKYPLIGQLLVVE